MIVIDSLRSAVKSLWSNKLRSFLTILGILIGIYAVVTLLAIARGVQSQTVEVIDEFGPTLLIVMPGEDTGQGGFNFAGQLAPSTISVADAVLLENEAKYLLKDSIDYVMFVGGSLKKADKKSAVVPYGGTVGSLNYIGFEKIAGRELTKDDISNKVPVIFITDGVAKELDAKLDDTVTLGVTEFKVAGIFRVKENSSLDPTTKNSVIIPASIGVDINKSDKVTQIVAKAVDIDSVAKAKEEVKSLLTSKHGTADMTVYQPSDLLKSFNQITDILTLMVVGIASISLLVGGIGISNIMLVTVTERTREIGIRKAVGATQGAIMLQFLIESIILTLMGALIGIGFAQVSVVLISKFSPLKATVTPEILLIALTMGLTAGIVFGLFPAYKAARKNPVEALRFE